ncbi:MAG: arginine decarboxylase [Candidatus Magasanikbacteria bacterium CG_4_10_14_0_2_um_filter_37_12]|uniref:Pyruvoyl-dependent arginine decarboxylase AaxB n=1 Tax=Candidatus Magasanikbacteria bacterium CG_4_10_14_0_2_um_filter_37_12 TaxID=1974637 RepID=A0A2M7VAE9_9BACT|nr:MAG: arginine decarboxylase [Candidatus Magasanikbacteria bacterium CG_4_10_14_0_2_um_filter_37_12]
MDKPFAFLSGRKSKKQEIIIGNRIPKDFFITQGKGQSDITVHAGSYHLALLDANIEKYNIMTYSSILPGIAQKITQPQTMVHGAVLESIMAVADGKKGERCTAGITWGWLYNKTTGEKYGGLVCEYHGSIPKDEAVAQLLSSLDELYVAFTDTYDLKNIENVTESFVPEKAYGTALVALGFTSYLVPCLDSEC